MKIELHILQNFAPSNLNRDDTGAPKDCELGGYRRGRISSQCLKRAVRDAFKTEGLFDATELGVRTKRLVDNVAKHLFEVHGRELQLARAMVSASLPGAGLKVKDAEGDAKSEYLLFLPSRHIERIAKLLDEHWDELLPLVGDPPSDQEESAPKKTKKSKKSAKQQAFPKDIGKELMAIFEDASATPDLALFGRMIADKPKWNVEAACQVAHAISTNRLVMDFDFYTAVDDLRPEDTTGSDMMGTVQFSSSCFYRYAVLDVEQLARNLGDDGDLTRRTIGAWLRASVIAIPTGKQNSMAAHNPPSFVLATLRTAGAPISLANAFTQPVRPDTGRDLVSASIDALNSYLGKVTRMYGVEGIEAHFVADREVPESQDVLEVMQHPNLEEWSESVQSAAIGARA